MTGVQTCLFRSSVCLGTACFVKGSKNVLAELEKQLEIKNGETTKDLKFSIECLRCVGACGLAPVVVIDGKVYSRVSPDDITDILNEYRELEVNC